MPAYLFECPVCHSPQRKILSPEEAKDGNIPCQKAGCAGKLRRKIKGPSTQITETLDNGLMPRRLERLADAERIFEERAGYKKGTI